MREGFSVLTLSDSTLDKSVHQYSLHHNEGLTLIYTTLRLTFQGAVLDQDSHSPL